MGHYIADVAALEAKFGVEVITQLIDLDADGTPDTTAVAQAIADAESTVESYLAKRYDLAALRAAKPPVVVELALSLAYYHLAKARDARLVGPGSDAEAIYQRAIARLKELAAGTAVLDVTTAVTEATSVEIDSNERLFTRTTMQGF
jgi:phage gp36-like protein